MEHHVLNLGAGVQSTAVYLLALDGKLKIDHAVFADTGDEPAAVYRHLAWLQSLNGPPILVRGRGRSLGDNLIHGRDWRKGHTSIPAFTFPTGQIRRQCTGDYKIEVVEQTIRRELAGLKPRQRFPSGTLVHQYFGISTDEAARAERAKKQFVKKKWAVPHYPLLEMGWNRRDCLSYLNDRVPHPVPKSACVFCPYRSNQSWADLKATDPAGFQRAVDIDRALRQPGTVAAAGMKEPLFLHPKRVLLKLVDFTAAGLNKLDPMAVGECTGMCGV